MRRGSSSAAGRVLVVLDDCGAGDALKVSWLVRALREALPGAVLTMLVSEPAEPVYRGSGLADRLVVSRLYRRRSGSRLRLRLAKAGELLRLAAAVGRGYDLVLTLWWGSTALHLLGRWAGRGRRIAYSCRLPRLLTSHLGPYDFRGDDVEQNARLLREAGLALDGPAQPELRPTAADTAAVGNLLGRHGPDGAPFVVLHTGSDWACQMWSPAGWAAVGDELCARGARVVFTGTAGEARYVDAIRARMRAPSLSVAGQTTMTELGALLTSASLCVCVDSAAYVVAQAVNVPTVVLAGPSAPERLVSRSRLPVVVNRTPGPLRSAIVACKEPRYPAGGCLLHECPMAGLRDVPVADVLAAVERSGALAPAAGRVAL